jgi:DnaD/phage-associated family protein
MEQFEGFPARMEFTPIPNLFLSTLAPRIDDVGELKVTLYALAALYRKRGYPRFVSRRELLGNSALIHGLKGAETSPDMVLGEALEMAARRGTLIHLALDRDGVPEDLYFLNTASDREAVARIQRGELKLDGLEAVAQTHVEVEEQPNIFALYEQNVGMLTPIIADELRGAEKIYPEAWISEAIREAVALNKRSIRYIIRILERWASEGKEDGPHRRHSKTDPDKYIKGRYGHMVQR